MARRTPARCSSCRARRTVAKHPDQYIRPPKCHMVGCGGLMRPDLFRMDPDNQAADRGVPCECDGRPGKHRLGQTGCYEREDWIIERVLTDTMPIDDGDVAPSSIR